MTTYTANGKNYDDEDLVGETGRGYNTPTVTGTGIEVPLYIAPMIDFLADANKALTTTSATSLSIGTGTKSPVLAADRPFAVGAFVTIARTSAPTTTYLYGQVTGYNSGTKVLDVDVTRTNGSGTHTDWTIQISGIPGVGSGILNLVEDTSPELGGNLDVLTQSIVSSSNRDINITPHGTGEVKPGVTNLADNLLKRAKVVDASESVFDLGTTSGAVAIDYTNGHWQRMIANGNITSVTVSNWPASGSAGNLTLEIKQDATGSRTIALSSAYVSAGGAGIVLTTTANATDKVYFTTRDAGTTIDSTIRKDIK